MENVGVNENGQNVYALPSRHGTRVAAENRPAPWFGSSTPVLPDESTASLLTRTGLAWGTVKVPNSYQWAGEQVDAAGSYTAVRDDTGWQLGKGSVGDEQTFLSNANHVGFCRTVEQVTGSPFEFLGSVKRGARVYSVNDLPDASFAVGGLESEQVVGKLLLQNCHTGDGSLKADVLFERLFCTNQLPGLTGGTFRLRHTANLDRRFEVATSALVDALTYAAGYRETAERLLAVEVEREQVEALVQSWVPLDPNRQRGADAVRDRQEALLANCLGSLTVPADVRGTAWGVLQGATEWSEHLVDHRPNSRTRPNEARFLRSLSGGPVAKFRDRVFSDLLGLVGPAVAG